MNETLIQIGGVYNIILIIFHAMFWRVFNWKEDLESLTFLNKAIIQVLNISLMLVFFIFSYISFAHANELLNTSLGRSVLVLITIFWFARAFQQVVFFKIKHWGSWAFLVFFTFGGIIYGIPIVYNT